MQRRERLLLIATATVVGLWGADTLIAGPYFAWLNSTRSAASAAAEKADAAEALVDASGRIMAAWRAQHAAGLLDDEDAVRYRMQQAIAAAARSSGLAVAALAGGQRSAAGTGSVYETLRLSLTGQGSLAQVMAFTAALESAAMPLRIERWEASSRDGRKDELDLAVTVSSRFAGSHATALPAIPEGTAPWRPEPRLAAGDARILAARPFLSERKAPRSEAAAPRAAPPPPPAGTWAVVGVASGADGAIAFMRHLGDGREAAVLPGHDLDGRTVAGIGADGVLFTDGTVIGVGSDLAGAAVVVPRTLPPPTPAPAVVVPSRSRAANPAPAAPAAAPPAALPTIPDADREAILQRLRQQRARSSGAAP